MTFLESHSDLPGANELNELQRRDYMTGYQTSTSSRPSNGCWATCPIQPDFPVKKNDKHMKNLTDHQLHSPAKNANMYILRNVGKWKAILAAFGNSTVHLPDCSNNGNARIMRKPAREVHFNSHAYCSLWLLQRKCNFHNRITSFCTHWTDVDQGLFSIYGWVSPQPMREDMSSLISWDLM